MLANNAFSSTVMDQAGDVHSVTRSNACEPLITAFKHFGYINLIKQLYLDPPWTTSEDKPTNLDHSTILEVSSNFLPPPAEIRVELDSALDSPPTSLISEVTFTLLVGCAGNIWHRVSSCVHGWCSNSKFQQRTFLNSLYKQTWVLNVHGVSRPQVGG